MVGGPIYSNLRPRRPPLILRASTAIHDLGIFAFASKKNAPSLKELWDVNRATLPRSLLISEISLSAMVREWH